MESIAVKRWGGHVKAAREQGLTLAKYARVHGLCARTLSRAERLLKTTPVPDNLIRATSLSSGVTASPFAAVQVELSIAALRVVLPNGITLHCDGADVAAWRELVTILASLPCSR